MPDHGDSADQQAPDFYRRLASGVPAILYIYRLSADGTGHSFPFVSGRIESVFGVSRRMLEQDADRVFELVHGDDLAALTASIRASREEMGPWRCEVRMRTSAGGYRWFEGYSTPEKQPDGSILWYGQFTDIQRHKELEAALRASETQFRTLVENANDIIYTVSPDGIFEFVSRGWTQALGHDVAEVIGRPFQPFVHPEDVHLCEEFLLRVLNTRQPQSGVEYRVRHQDSSWRWHTSNAAPVYDDNRNMVYFLGIARDITAKRDADAEVAYQARFQSLLARLSGEFLKYGFTDIDSRINYLLSAIGEFFQVDRAYLYRFSGQAQTMTNTHEWVREGVPALIDSQQEVAIDGFHWWKQRLWQELARDQVVFVADVSELPESAAEEKALLHSQGVASMFCVPVRINSRVAGFFGVDSLTLRDWREDQGELLLLVSRLLSEALERHRLEQQLLNQSIRDPLTGLHNRRYLIPRLEEMLAQRVRHGDDFAVILFDLDHFKDVNDTLGHLAGDYVLREVTSILLESTRSMDVVARYGGEEFVMVLATTGHAKARLVAQRILDEIRDYRFLYRGQPITVTTSAGLVVCSELVAMDPQPDHLIEIADYRLYQAKSGGRNRLVDG